MNVYEIQSWTFDFVERNETECADFVVSMQNDALNALKNGSFVRAAEMFKEIVRGMGILSAIDKDFYEPPYYAACLHLCKIEAFGLKNLKDARLYLEKACKHAEACAQPGRPTAQTAEQDLVTMKAMLVDFEKGVPASEIADKFGIGAPYTFSKVRKSTKVNGGSTRNKSLAFGDIKLSKNVVLSVAAVLVLILVICIVVCLLPEDKPKTVSEIQDSRPELQNQTVIKQEQKAIVVSNNGLNVRKEPSVDGALEGTLQKNTTVIILEEQDEWVKVEYGETSGWCSKEFLKFVSEEN